MKDLRILTIQDISCFGQCSTTVALPILSACGFETAIMPSSFLSTHTGGFKGFTFLDLTEEMEKISAHWEKEKIFFDCLYTGFLGNKKQVEVVKNVIKRHLNKGGLVVIDPAMADNGKLYPCFDKEYALEMKKLVFMSDIMLPNVTEACLLIDEKYQENHDEKYIESLCLKLKKLGAKKVVITGINFSENTIGIAVFDGEKCQFYKHERVSKGCHGTGDVYSSAFVGAYLKGKGLFESAKIAADYVVKCIKSTIDDQSHWYGVKFEKNIPYLIDKIK